MNRMETKHEVQITLEEFKLIKQFYPDFHRKQSPSNDFIIGWSELMPVVEKILNELKLVNWQTPREIKEWANAQRGRIERKLWDCLYKECTMQELCDEIAEVIKWMEMHKQEP